MVCVVCAAGEAPRPARGLAWLESADLVVAADGGLAFLRALGRRADLWLGDGDSSPGPEASWAPWFGERLSFPPDKDHSDTELAVAEALRRGADEVWLLGGAGARLDHTLANWALLVRETRVRRWLTGREEIHSLEPGDSLDVAAGTLSVFPLGEGPWQVRDRGLRWPLAGFDFARGYSLSNRAGEDGRIEVLAGRVAISLLAADSL